MSCIIFDVSILEKIVDLIISRQDRKEDWVDLKVRLRFLHRPNVVEDFGRKEQVFLTVVLENHGRTTARVKSVTLILWAKPSGNGVRLNNGVLYELSVPLLPLYSQQLNNGVLEVKGKETGVVTISDSLLYALLEEQYGKAEHKLASFRKPLDDVGFRIAVKSNMEVGKEQVVHPHDYQERIAAKRMAELAVRGFRQ